MSGRGEWMRSVFCVLKANNSKNDRHKYFKPSNILFSTFPLNFQNHVEIHGNISLCLTLLDFYSICVSERAIVVDKYCGLLKVKFPSFRVFKKVYLSMCVCVEHSGKITEMEKNTKNWIVHEFAVVLMVVPSQPHRTVVLRFGEN